MSRSDDSARRRRKSPEDVFERRLAIGQIVAVWLVLVAKAYMARYFVLGDANVLSAIVLEGVFLGGLLVVIDALFPDHRFGALLTADLALSSAMLATVVYSAYYGDVPTPALIGLAGQASTVKDSITGLLNWADVLFYLDLPLFIAGVFVVGRYRRRRGIPLKQGHFYVRQPLAVLALGACAVAGALWLGLGVTRLPDPVDGRAASRVDGLFTYQIASAVPRPKVVSAVDLSSPQAVQREIYRLRGGTTGKRIADFPEGAAKGKNVIIIQVEALQDILLGLKVDGQEVTPNLNKLAAQSYYFPNTFTQIGSGSTADAELTMNSSLYPAVAGASPVKMADREIPSLPRMVRAAGYDALTFHGNTVHFWNRMQLYGALGFNKYFDAEFFRNSEKFSMGPTDEALFKDSLPELVRRDKEGKKFLAEFITLSSHRPFEQIPPDRQGITIPAVARGTLPGNYVISQNYADKAIGQFMRDLETSGLADKTIVIVYGDHWGLADDNNVAAQKALFGRMNNEYDLLNIPLIIHMPGQTSGTEVQDAAGQIDITPSLVDALGLDASHTPLFGRDLFVRSRVLLAPGRIVSIGSYVDEGVMFVPGSGFSDGRAFDISTKLPTNTTMASADKWQRMRDTIQLSDSYTQSLPKRADYVKDTQSQVPQVP